jgi:hypothetical protein
VLRNKFGPKRVMKSRRRWAGLVACKRHRRGAYRLLVWTTDGRRTLVVLTTRWEINIKMDFKKWDVVWTELNWPMGGTCGGLFRMRQ